MVGSNLSPATLPFQGPLAACSLVWQRGPCPLVVSPCPHGGGKGLRQREVLAKQGLIVVHIVYEDQVLIAHGDHVLVVIPLVRNHRVLVLSVRLCLGAAILVVHGAHLRYLSMVRLHLEL